MSILDSELNVLMISPEYPPAAHAGIGTHVVQLATGMLHRVKGIDVYSYSSETISPYEHGGLFVRYITHRQELGNDLAAHVKDIETRMTTQILEEYGLRGQKPDVVHIHDWNGINVGLAIAKLYQVPLVSTVHLLHDQFSLHWGETSPEYVISGEHILCKKSDHIIAVSDSLRIAIQDLYHVERHRISRVYNGVEVSQSSRSVENRIKIRAQLGLSNKNIVLFVGRIHPQKGIEALLKSSNFVLAHIPDVHYLIAGSLSQPYAREVQDTVKRNEHLAQHVEFLGWQSRQQLKLLYVAADVAVVPSIYEPLGYVALEAMANELPVIATATGGLSEILDNGKNGQLVPVVATKDGKYEPHCQKLAEAQISALSNPEKLQEQVVNGLNHLTKIFTIESMVEGVLDVYRRAITSHQIS
jgi:alpha-maltose-1-phosphate synthase